MSEQHPLAEVETACGTWEDFTRELNGLPNKWVLRGHREACWLPRTTLERHAPPLIPREKAESTLRLEFKRRAHFYLQPQQIPMTTVEWLALMQHFGAPTRLLDFTYSPYVAAYFALEDAGECEKCAVLCVNRAWCLMAAGKILRGVPALRSGLLRKGIGIAFGPDVSEPMVDVSTSFGVAVTEKLFVEHVLSNESRVVLPVEPDRLSERLSIQQGTFLCPGDARVPFLDNLRAMPDWCTRENVRLITLPFTNRARALQELRKMNITRASLFPGLDGFAQSFRNLLEREPDDAQRLRQVILEGVGRAAGKSTVTGVSE